MVNHLSNVKCGYTDYGNRYEKSSDGKKTGKIAGAALGTVAAATKTASLNADILREAKEVATADFSNALKKAAGISEKVLTEDTFSYMKSTVEHIPMQDKVVKLLSKSKGAKVGFVAATVIGTIAAFTLAGKAVGNIYDKAVDVIARHKADIAALDKAALKKNEE